MYGSQILDHARPGCVTTNHAAAITPEVSRA